MCENISLEFTKETWRHREEIAQTCGCTHLQSSVPVSRSDYEINPQMKIYHLKKFCFKHNIELEKYFMQKF